MYLSLERIASLSAPGQAQGNGAGVSHKKHAPMDVHTHTVSACKHTCSRQHIHAYAYMEAHDDTREHTHAGLPVSGPPLRPFDLSSHVYVCVCVFEYLKDLCRSHSTTPLALQP